MPTNLLELAKGFFTGPVTRQISGLLGESEATTESAIEAAVPSVLAGLGMQASTPGGASALSASLDRIDTSFLGNLTASLSGGGSQRLIESGSQVVKSVFGNSLNAVSDGISRASGMGKAAIGSLLGLITPVVLGMLAKQRKTQGLDTNELSHLLADQKPYLASQLPSGIGDALGLAGMRSAVGDAAHATHDTGRAAVGTAGRVGHEAGRQGSSLLMKLLPLLLLLGLGVIVWRIIGSRDTSGVVGAQETTTQVDDVGRQVGAAVESATSALANVTDEASARAALPTLEEAARNVSTLGSMVSSMPDSVRTSVGQTVSGLLPSFQSLADKALDIPGVSSVIGPAVQKLMDGLARFRA